MKYLALFLVANIFVFTFAAPKPASDVAIDPFIVGGINALQGEFPFIISIQWVILGLSTHVCGGSIISPLWILSAAHCLTEVPTLGRLEVLAGINSLSNFEAGQSRLGINRPASIIHPDFVPGGAVGPDDLCVIRLATSLVYSATIQPISLPAADSIPTGSGTIAGWGQTNSGGIIAQMPDLLQKAILSFITVEQCRTAINNMGFDGSLVDYTNVCTGPLTGGLAVCSGDSGGPLVQGNTVVGVVSWGFSPCGTTGAPSGVFKRVSAYNSWIRDHTGVQ